MKKANFTAERVAGFKCEPGKQQSIYWDGKTPGLGLRVTAGGAKSYIFESRLHGHTIRITIGDIRTWTIGKAQKEATDLRALTDKGIDPRQRKEEQRAATETTKLNAKRQTLTLGEVWPLYLEAQKPKWSDRHYQDHLSLAAAGGQKKKRGKGETVAGPLASLMSLRLAELTGGKIAEWLEDEAEQRPTNAAQSFRKLRAFIRWAEDVPAYRGLIPEDAYSARIVKDAVPPSRAKEGDSLQREQLKAWFDAVGKLDNPVVTAYLQALLLTGARREEMAGLRWEDVDFQWC